MNSLHGLDVVVSQYVQDTPKLKFSCGEPTPTIHKFNAWLLCMFGSNPTYFQIGNRIITNERGKRLLMGATKDHAK